MRAREWTERHWSDPARAKILAEEGTVLDAADMITEFMEQSSISRAELAQRIGISKPAISQALNGGRNLTLRTLGRLAWGLGASVQFALVPAKSEGWSRIRVPSWHRRDGAQPRAWETESLNKAKTRQDSAASGGEAWAA